MTKKHFSITVCLLLLLVGFGLQSAWGQDAAPDVGQIAFVGRQGIKPEIFLINADGSGLVQLTDNNLLEQNPVWSPDGTQLAYVTFSQDMTSRQIMVMQADGSDQKPLVTDQAQGADFLSWSPDGKQIAFSTLVGPGNQDVFVADAATGTSRNLTPDDPAMDIAPQWSPDSTEILYQFQGKQNGAVIINPATGETRPVNLPPRAQCSAWSADGERLICSGQEGIFSLDAHDQQDKVAISSLVVSPEFSPDGKKILYIHSDIQTSPQTVITSAIGVMDTDGSNNHVLIEGIDGFVSPSWSPDSQQLAYALQSSSGFFDLYVIHADGIGGQKIAEQVIEDKPPAWRPSSAPS